MEFNINQAEDRSHTSSEKTNLISNAVLKLRPPPTHLTMRRKQRKKRAKVIQLSPSRGIKRFLVPNRVLAEARDEPGPIHSNNLNLKEKPINPSSPSRFSGQVDNQEGDLDSLVLR